MYRKRKLQISDNKIMKQKRVGAGFNKYKMFPNKQLHKTIASMIGPSNLNANKVPMLIG